MNKKKDVIERLCDLVSKVGGEHFAHGLTHDCFCHESGTGNNGFSCEALLLVLGARRHSRRIARFV